MKSIASRPPAVNTTAPVMPAEAVALARRDIYRLSRFNRGMNHLLDLVNDLREEVLAFHDADFAVQIARAWLRAGLPEPDGDDHEAEHMLFLAHDIPSDVGGLVWCLDKIICVLECNASPLTAEELESDELEADEPVTVAAGR